MVLHKIRKKLKHIPQNVFVLGLVSFFTDASSDMIYPFLPIFLMEYLHASHGFLGLVEGWAESAAAFFTLFSGIMADRAKDRSKLVLAGYTLSSLSRPLIAFAWNPWVVFLVRFFDRVGKGTRTAPRDALIADSVHSEHRGSAYGLHRSMDHMGAVCGPLIAMMLLSGPIHNLRYLFLFAAIPGLAAVVLILWKVREVLPHDQRAAFGRRHKIEFPKGRLRVYLCILFVFILSCSSDAFLILRAKELGVSLILLPILWMIFNIVKAGSTLPFGMLSDKIGRRRMILFGWMIYILVYIGFALAHETWHAWLLFISYGFFYGATEGSERAILADYAEPHARAQAFGWYYFIVGLGALPASLIFGFIWQMAGAKTAFLTSAVISTAAAMALGLFLRLVPSPQKAPPDKMP